MKNTIRALGVALCAAALAGCATTSGLSATETRSGFDGARVVDIRPHGAACKKMICVSLGAQWASTAPDVAILHVAVINDFTAITGAKLSVDREIIELSPMPGLTTFSKYGDPLKESRKSFTAPLSLARRITASKDVWIRVSTPAGYLEDAIITEQEDSKAFHALGRFLASVDQTAAK